MTTSHPQPAVPTPAALRRWIPLAEAARMAGVTGQKLSRRIRGLERRTGIACLRPVGGRGRNARYVVSAAALAHVLRGHAPDDFLRLEDRVAALEEQIEAVRVLMGPRLRRGL